ncbi:MAG: hypothetical protein AAGE99_03495 [Chlamydiota bacterium]
MESIWTVISIEKIYLCILKKRNVAARFQAVIGAGVDKGGAVCEGDDFFFSLNFCHRLEILIFAL